MRRTINEISERFGRKVDVRGPDECWEWLAGKDQNGYGQFFPESKWCVKAHRFAYILAVAPFFAEPEVFVRMWGLRPLGDGSDADRILVALRENVTIDHLCRNRGCCNPWHLEPVTRAENVKRGGNTVKTHCPQGHLYDYSWTDGVKSQRSCTICRREANRRWRSRHSA